MVMRRLFSYVCTGLILSTAFPISPAHAGDQEMVEMMLNEIAPYMSDMGEAVQNREGSVENALPGLANGGDPQDYGGLELPFQAMLDDFVLHHTIGFTRTSCGLPKILGFNRRCTRRILGVRIPTGLLISYRFPVQTIETGGFWQSRYVPKFLYDAFEQANLLELSWYPVAKFLAPIHMRLVAEQSARITNMYQNIRGIDGGGNLDGGDTPDETDTDLEAFNQRSRYQNGVVGGTPHLEFHVGPTFLLGAVIVLENYYPWLRFLLDGLDQRIPFFMSEMPGLILYARDPWLQFTLMEDTDFLTDLAIWLAYPSVCTSFRMSTDHQKTPFDALIPLYLPLGDVPYLGEVYNYVSDLCTTNWGNDLPATSYTMHYSDAVNSGINVLKGIRLGRAMQLTFVGDEHDNEGSDYWGFYPFNKEDDRIQWTYNHDMPRGCQKVGDFAPPFGANGSPHHTASNLYSVTHWRYVEKCLGFGDVYNIVSDIIGSSTEMPSTSELESIGEDLTWDKYLDQFGDILGWIE